MSAANFPEYAQNFEDTLNKVVATGEAVLQVIPKPHPWMPACAGMTGIAWFFVIPVKAGIQSVRRQEV